MFPKPDGASSVVQRAKPEGRHGRASVDIEDGESAWLRSPIDGYPTDGIVLVTVTPQMAADWLARKRHNRTLNKAWAKQLEQRFARGEWRDTREAILFDKDGFLINGQHRLDGVVNYGKPVQLWVGFGLEPEAMEAIDTGRSRSGADVATIKGYDYPDIRMASLSILLRWQEDPDPWAFPLRNKRYSPMQLLYEQQANYPEITDYLRGAVYIRTHGISGGAATWGALLLRMARIDYDAAEEFKRGVAIGAGLAEDSPILGLRNELQNKGRKLTAIEQEQAAGNIIRAWSYWRHGRRTKEIRWRKDRHPFPILE